MPSTIKITLYHWDKCGYCIEYLAEGAKEGWKKMCKSYKKTPDGHVLEYNEVEQQDMEKKYKDLISSYPTIVIDDGKTEYKYTGERIINEILKTVDKCIKKEDGDYKPLQIMSGGKIGKSKKIKKLKSLITEDFTKSFTDSFTEGFTERFTERFTENLNLGKYNYNNTVLSGGNNRSLTRDLFIEDIKYNYLL